ncbi:hypothetical protein GOP47_0005425 [Adiantum capillus-veneris]|uniref:Secreted protein n=1 Tax=Adiantum capillus-veneris TaxID=13818 RepID=A0A9D4ZNJ7_ADICA|nr:hypothetical protein GOP47_0005425 [Adiantum capillus-veneris]
MAPATAYGHPFSFPLFAACCSLVTIASSLDNPFTNVSAHRRKAPAHGDADPTQDDDGQSENAWHWAGEAIE